jgi:hypothetical protein
MRQISRPNPSSAGGTIARYSSAAANSMITSKSGSSLLILVERLSRCIKITTGNYRDQVYNPPYSTTTPSEKLDQPNACVTSVEAVNTQATQKNTEQESS